MNTKIKYTAITVASLIISTMVSAHDPSKHAGPKEKPNCEAMHQMGSPEMDMNDPVMQAMMKQCGKSKMKGHHDQQDTKPTCTEEHSKLGHCTLSSDISNAKKSGLSDSEAEHD